MMIKRDWEDEYNDGDDGEDDEIERRLLSLYCDERYPMNPVLTNASLALLMGLMKSQAQYNGGSDE